MKKNVFICVVLSGLAMALSSCAQNEMSSPCPDFGRHCFKQPVNSWDYERGTK